MRFPLPLLALISILLTGCSPLGGSLGRVDSKSHTPGNGVLGQLRPKVDPRYIERARQEEYARAQEQMAQAQAQGGMNNGNGGMSTDGMGRVLPRVITDPISGQMSSAGTLSQSSNESVNADLNAGTNPAVQSAQTAQANSGTGTGPEGTITPVSDQSQGQIMVADASKAASYGAYGSTVPPPPPGSLSGGSLSPPPPAVTLSTQANVGSYQDPNNPYGNPNPYANPYAQQNPYANPYANPYLNPYAIPYQGQGYPPQPMIQQQPERPSGLFGSGQRAPKRDDEEVERKKVSTFVPITPTGMDSRSPYKQRDDLKVLWKGALSTATIQQISGKDPRLAESLNRIDVGLPLDGSKGNFSVAQRQIDAIFKPVAIDRRVAPAVKRAQTDLVQSYYRYLYTYNKFALAQQTYAARKQEVEVATTDSEKQRAAADVAQSQNEAESSRDDMKTAQMELSAVAGANAARSIISRVSGISPSMEALTQAEPQAAPAERTSMFGGLGGLGNLGGIGSFFGMGNKPKTNEQEAPVARVAMAAPAKKTEKVQNVKPGKEPKKEKVKEKKKEVADKGDLQPSSIAAASAQAAREVAREPERAPVAVDSSPVQLQLKGVTTTARKSVLTVAIKNSGQSDFSFNPESFAVSENNHKLSEAAMRADFETTLVQPSQEVNGTITIFGRPWNERLTISLSDGTHNLQMHR